MVNANSLYLLADHIKLSLLERQRAQALSLEGGDSQDGHISRSLDQFREGLEALDNERVRLEEAGDESKALSLADAIPSLQKQLDDLTAQFHGFSSPSNTATLTHPNDPSLAADFTHASTAPDGTTTVNAPSSSTSSSTAAAAKPPAKTSPNPKTVRFQDNPRGASPAAHSPSPVDPNAARLFNRPYRDEPDDSGTAGYRDQAESENLDNVAIHALHGRVLAEQDAQLDALGDSISRQRELSMQIGDELDSHVAMLEEGERLVDRHQGRLDRARRQVGRIARSAGESKQMVAIVVLIVILVLLIAVLK